MKSNRRLFLGIDTSCYTTSCALVDEEGRVVSEAKKLLEVPLGKRGLQQSQMVFQHTKVLPFLMESLVVDGKIAGIGVSGFPRREENSYMPAFLVGLGQGRTLSHCLGVPLHVFSHQENHILAALRDVQIIPEEPFYSLHLSGGTSELLYSRREGAYFHTELLAHGDDIAAGQMIDRIGVAMGLPFPAGPALEQLALAYVEKQVDGPKNRYGHYKTTLEIPSVVKGGTISFGGPTSALLRILEKGEVNHEEVAYATLLCVVRSLWKALDQALAKKQVRVLVAVGGVMANSILRKELESYGKEKGLKVYVAKPEHSTDNATGCAYGANLLDKE